MLAHGVHPVWAKNEMILITLTHPTHTTKFAATETSTALLATYCWLCAVWLCCGSTELLLKILQLQQLVQGLQRGLVRARQKGLRGLGWWLVVVLLLRSGRCHLPLSLLLLVLRELDQQLDLLRCENRVAIFLQGVRSMVGGDGGGGGGGGFGRRQYTQ